MKSKYESGDLILLTSGDYDDYGVISLYRATMNLDLEVLSHRWRDNEVSINFIDYLINLELIDPVHYDEFWLDGSEAWGL